jgi:hypothetical protein
MPLLNPQKGTTDLGTVLGVCGWLSLVSRNAKYTYDLPLASGPVAHIAIFLSAFFSEERMGTALTGIFRRNSDIWRG